MYISPDSSPNDPILSADDFPERETPHSNSYNQANGPKKYTLSASSMVLPISFASDKNTYIYIQYKKPQIYKNEHETEKADILGK